MKIIIDIGFLEKFTIPKAVCDINNELSYRQNHRYTHRYEKYGLLKLMDVIRSDGKGAPKIVFGLTSFGKELLNHFNSFQSSTQEATEE